MRNASNPEVMNHRSRFPAMPLLLLILAATVSDLQAQSSWSSGVVASATGTVRVGNSIGSVRITGWARDSVAVQALMPFPGHEITLETVNGETRVTVATQLLKVKLGRVDLVVSVPHGSSVFVRGAADSVAIFDVSGAADVETTSGAIRISGVANVVRASTTSGSIDVASPTLVLQAESLTGNVNASAARGRVNLSTVSGAIMLRGAGLGEGRASTVGGAITFSGDFDPGGSFVFETHDGPISLRLDPAISADVELLNIAAVQRNDFSVKNSARFSINGGGPRVQLRTFAGSISLIAVK